MADDLKKIGNQDDERIASTRTTNFLEIVPENPCVGGSIPPLATSFTC